MRELLYLLSMGPGDIIRKAREKAGESGRGLAAAAGFDPAYLWSVECGRARPPPRLLRFVSERYGLSVSELLIADAAEKNRMAILEPDAGLVRAMADAAEEYLEK